MKSIFVLMTAFTFSFAAQAMPEEIMSLAKTSIETHCELGQGRLKQVSESAEKIAIDQGQFDVVYTLGFAVSNKTNDDDEDLIEVQITDAQISNPNADSKPVVTGLKVFGWTKCN